MFIIADKIGRLGNRLFLFAHIIAAAIEKKRAVMNLAFYEYARFFQTTSKDILCRYTPKENFIKGNNVLSRVLYSSARCLSCLIAKCQIKSKYIKSIVWQDMKNPYILDSPEFSVLVNNNKLIFFQGWLFRAYKYVEKYSDEIQSYFKPQKVYENKIKSPIFHLQKSCEIIFGITMRHGDYRQYQEGRYFYSLKQYLHLMKQAEQLFPKKKVGFLICSDEEQDVTFFSNFNFYFRSGHIIENLYSLAECDYIISPPSTYSMWASFYGKVPCYLVHNPEKSLSIKSFVVIKG